MHEKETPSSKMILPNESDGSTTIAPHKRGTIPKHAVDMLGRHSTHRTTPSSQEIRLPKSLGKHDGSRNVYDAIQEACAFAGADRSSSSLAHLESAQNSHPIVKRYSGSSTSKPKSNQPPTFSKIDVVDRINLFEKKSSKLTSQSLGNLNAISSSAANLHKTSRLSIASSTNASWGTPKETTSKHLRRAQGSFLAMSPMKTPVRTGGKTRVIDSVKLFESPLLCSPPGAKKRPGSLNEFQTLETLAKLPIRSSISVSPMMMGPNEAKTISSREDQGSFAPLTLTPLRTPVPRTSAVLDRVKLFESVSPKEGIKSEATLPKDLIKTHQVKKQNQAAIANNDDWKKRNNGWRNVFATPSLKIDAATFTPPSYPKTDSDVTLISSSFEQSYILKKLCKQQDASGSAHSKMVKAMEPLQVSKGEVIEQQGQIGEHFYIVQEGQVDFQVDGIVVGSAAPGTSFGQVNLLHSAPNKSSVVARNKTKLLRVDQATFRGIMQTSSQPKPTTTPTPPTVLELVKSPWEEECSSALEQLNEIRSFVTANVALEDLERISVLGEGQFGEVWLCQATLQTSTEKFALKIQPKENESQGAGAENAIRKEIATMQALHHPFLAHLVHNYEDNENMYMLMGLIPGGELWELIHKQDDAGDWTSGIPESHAKFYALVMADALAYMHSKRFIFRDLKPENVMIDADGYPLLVDFGLSKRLGSDDNGKTFTFCGTPNYVPPELIQSVGHDFGVDHWALGVIIYEMIAGENPFYFDGMSESELYQAICDEEYYPLKSKQEGTPLGGSIVDLINKLLEKDPALRLGMLAGGEMDLFQHPWFDGLDLPKIRSKQMPAPWIPGKSTSKEEAAVDVPEGQSRHDEHPARPTSLLCEASSDEAHNDGHKESLENTISGTIVPNEQGDDLIATIETDPNQGCNDEVNAWGYDDFDCDVRHELRPEGLFASGAKAQRSWKVKI